MRVEFRLPDVGEGIAEARVVRWLVREGEAVGRDQPLVEVETDKAVVVLPSPVEGQVQSLAAAEGQTVTVGQVLVVLEPAAVPVRSGGQAAPPAGGPQELPEPAPEAGGSGQSREAGILGSAPQPLELAATIPASPEVRRLARRLGVRLEGLRGSGPDGRITEADVRQEALRLGRTMQPSPEPAPLETGSLRPAAASPARADLEPPGLPPSQAPSEAAEGSVRLPLSGMRRAIALHLAEAVRRAPYVTVVEEADVTELVGLRERLRPAAERAGVRLTYLPFVILAAVRALKAMAIFNATVDEQAGELQLHSHFHIGVATALPGGLIVPVIRDADRKGVVSLARELEELARRAREGRLEWQQLQGGTFTVTSLGAAGGLWATPIVNHPQVAILGVYRIQPRPVVREGQVVVRSMVNLSLTFDHRVADGEQAVRFLGVLIEGLQQPEALALGLLPAGGMAP